MWDLFVKVTSSFKQLCHGQGKPDLFKFSFVLISCLCVFASKTKDMLITFKVVRVNEVIIIMSLI
jgi:hypothetical protein